MSICVESENDLENVGDISLSNSDTKVDIPAEFFEDLGDVDGKKARFFRCLFEGCKTKLKKDGTPKYLIVKNDSRHNAKRHFLAHDPHGKLGHKDKWRSAISKISSKENLDDISWGPFVKLIVQQSDLDDWIMNFIIVDVLPIHVVEKPGFQALVSSLAPHLTIQSRTFFTEMIVKKYHDRQQQLKDALFNCTDAASTLDAWTCRRRSYLGETIHWYDSKSLKKKNACLAVRRIHGHHTYDVLVKLIKTIHSEYQVKDKLRGSTTDNGSNFLKCFKERGASSSLPNYDNLIDEELEENLQEDVDENMVYFEIGDILADPPLNATPQNENVTLPVHRKCACHLLSLICKVDILKIQDPFFEQLRSTVFGKLQQLWNKQSSCSLSSDLIMRYLGRLFVVKNDTRWNSEYSAVCCFVRLLKKNFRQMKKLFEEFKIDFISPNEDQFLKEYVKVMKSVCEALDILQGEKNVGMGFLLPTLSVLKNNLKSLKDDASIIHCQPLITSLLDAIHLRFERMFSDNELRLATISNPMFKLSWLENEEQYNRAKSLLTCEFNRLKGNIENPDSSEESSDGTSSSRSDPSPEKRRKKIFFSSITKKISRAVTNDEIEKYLNFCQTLEQLNDYPTMTSIYKRYNVTLPSSASVERLFSQGGLIFTPKRLKLTDKNFEMLLFLKVNHKVFQEW